MYGDIVRGHRRRLGLSQDDLAERANVSVRTIRKIEAGRITRPRPATIQLLADAFGLTGTDREDFCVAAVAGPAPASADRDIPAQLPADVPGFVGRVDEMGRLTRLLDAAAFTGPVLISAISGTPGVGKTALAVHWAHRVRDRFPDGQLFVDLRGYDARQPVHVGDALAAFLRALGRDEVPVDIDERAATYRSLLAGRRMLVVLDNAATVEQVRPLLPGSPTCVTVVTSRDSLPGLVARNGARRVELDALTLAEAARLIEALVGERALVDPAATSALARHCCQLPLALRIAAEVAASRVGAPLADLVGELADQSRRLDLLDLPDDPQAAVRSVFSWSFRRMPSGAARLFRLLGLHPGADFDDYAAAALAGTDVANAAGDLDLLVRAHLVRRSGHRYSLHDLLRAYAAELVAADEGAAAVGRLLDYYLATAASAMDTLHPAEVGRRPRVAAGGGPAPSLSDPAAALAWLDAERTTLIAVTGYAARNGAPEHAVRVAATLFRYLESGAHHVEALTVHTHALHAARAMGATADEGYAMMNLGTVHGHQGRMAAAADYHRAAIALFQQADDLGGEGRAVGNLGWCLADLGQPHEAVELYLRARELCARVGDLVGEGRAWSNVAAVYGWLGETRQSVAANEKALTIFRGTGEQGGEARIRANLGAQCVELGRADEAIDHLQIAVVLFHATGHRRGEAHALNDLGSAYRLKRQYAEAVEHHEQALLFLRDTGDAPSTAETLIDLGRSLSEGGRLPEALERLREGLSLASATGVPLQVARAHHGLAESWGLAGATEQARGEWRRALEIYQSIGAVAEVAAARASLESLGVAAP